ncbi:MAG: drug resistance transporter, EmrB/QacA subfamily [Actinoallomurus sp.]|jgi:hypothetical protein|nr:drug resistance transporter, EmrB/QacA subfamily [Actinoallomurus sp.]
MSTAEPQAGDIAAGSPPTGMTGGRAVAFSMNRLSESREPETSGLPDPYGAVLIAVTPATAFYATLPGNVMFLQTAWHYSVPRSALANVPGPLVVLVIARTATRLAGRFGTRPVLLTGAVAWPAGPALFALQADASPRRLAHWLPGTLLIGLSTGLTLPVQLVLFAGPMRSALR